MPRALGEDGGELHSENAGSACGDDGTLILMRGQLFRDDKLDDQIMRNREPCGRLNVADRMRARLDARWEFHLDEAAGGVKIGLPAVLEVAAANLARVLVQDALVLAADLVGVAGARRRDHLAVLLELPVHLADAPPLLVRFVHLHTARDAHLHVELANRVDDRGQDHGRGQIRGREDADRGAVVAREQGARDLEAALNGQGVLQGGDGFGGEDVVDLALGAVGACGEVAR